VPTEQPPTVDTVYYQRNGYWYSIPRQVFSSPTEQEVREFRLLLERDFVPPTFFDSLSPPLLSSLSSHSVSEYFPSTQKVMGSPPIRFRGDGNVGVKAFLRWLDSWFFTQGEGYLGDTEEVKRARAAQIYVACPIGSEAGRFLRQLPDDILKDDGLLRKALMEQFEEEDDDSTQEDILAVLNRLHQGEHTVFSYSRKVLKVLRGKPASVTQIDQILTGYYIEGLASQRLRDMAIMSFQGSSSDETPSKVVKGVMRLAVKLKLRGYRKYRYGDPDDSDEEEETDEGDDYDDNDDDSYDSDDNAHRCSKRSSRRSSKSTRHSEKKSKNKDDKEENSIRGEMKELRGMFLDLMKSQSGASSSTALVPARPEADIIPLDTYAVGRPYGNYPPPTRYAYEQRNASHPTARRSDYPNRRSYASPVPDYNRNQDPGPYRPLFDSPPGQEFGRAGPSAHPSYPEYESTRWPVEGTHYGQHPGQQQGPYRASRVYEEELPPPATGSRNASSYPSRLRICFHCQEEGYFRPQCPCLNNPPMRTNALRPEHPDTATPPAEEPPAKRENKPVCVVEIAAKSSALEGMKVREVKAAELDPFGLKEFVHRVEEVDRGDNHWSRCDNSDDDDEIAPVMAGERARRFSELPPEFDGEPGPSGQRRKIANNDNDNVMETTAGKRKVRSAVSRVVRKPIRMMAGREKFDYIGSFREAPVTGLNWVPSLILHPWSREISVTFLFRSERRGKEKEKEKVKPLLLTWKQNPVRYRQKKRRWQ
jgi:hypothetical protein